MSVISSVPQPERGSRAPAHHGPTDLSFRRNRARLRAALLAGCLGSATAHAQLGEKLWEFEADGAIRGSPALTSDGGVVFGSMGGRLYALKSSGAKRWEFVGGGAFQGSPAVGADDTIYAGTTGSRFYAVNSGGTLRWTWTAGGRISSTPAVAPGGAIYVSSEDRTLTALSSTGTPQWVYRADDSLEASPVVATDGTIYVASRDRRLHAINPDGTPKWVVRPGQVPDGPVALGAGGILYLGGSDSRLRALRPDGSQLWELVTDKGINTTPVVGPDGTIYVVTTTARAYAVRPDGTALWDAVVPGTLGSSSPALGADGVLHFGTLEGKLLALNPDGSVKWSYASSNKMTWSSPALGADGRVYVGNDGGKLFALRGSAGLAASVWPMFQRDARHTASGFVERALPEAYAAGLELEVTLVTNPGAGVGVHTVDDVIPAGWQVGEVDHEGVYDAANRRVRFGPFFDARPRRLAYRVTPPLGDAGSKQFNGSSTANGAERLVGGDQVLSAIPLHPADNRPVDGWVTLGELTAYGAAWKRGAAWPLAPASIPGAYLVRAVALWQNGESYRYDTNYASAPNWWLAPGQPPYGEPPPGLTNGVVANNGTAIASAPAAYRPGAALTVAISVTPATNIAVYAVEDQPPAGWPVSALSDGGVFDPATGKAKWGPFFDVAPRTLSYQTRAPSNATNVVEFRGVAAFDGTRGEVRGQRLLRAGADGWPDPIAQRVLPDGYSPGAKLTVTLEIAALGSAAGTLFVADTPPADWTVGAISAGGVFDAASGVVRFGPFLDGLPATCTYELTPPANETGLQQFYGTFTLDDVPGLVTGDGALDLVPLHPADLQLPDTWLGIAELTAYGAAWKRGASWSIEPDPISDDYMGQAALLWQSGEAYRYETNAGAAPLCWIPLPPGITPSAVEPAPLPAGTVATNGTALADMPVQATPGSLVSITLTVTPATNVMAYAVADSPPEGWKVVLGQGPPVDPLRGKVRWGPFYDAVPRVFEYQALVPADARGLADFQGVAAFDGARGEIAGQRRIEVQPAAGALVAERVLPPAYAPGARLQVTIRAVLPPELRSFALEDKPPAGWQIGPISAGGAWDSQNRKVMWVAFGPAADGLARTNVYTYEVTPPAGESGRRFFSGLILMNEVEGLVAGNQALDAIPPLHPADLQWSDLRISLMEVTAYGAAWKRGTSWPTPPSRVPTDYLNRAASLWRGGEGYAVDASVTNAPDWWVPAPGTVPSDVLVPAGAAATNGTAKVERPHFVVAGDTVTMKLTVTPAATVAACAVEDQVPAGWTVAVDRIGGEGVWDPAQRKVKWGPFFDGASRVLTYQVTPTPDAPENSTFAGGAAFDGAPADLVGRRQVFRTDGALVDEFQLTLLSWQPAVGAQIQLTGVPGEVYSVLASPDLDAWVVLGSLTNTAITNVFLDRTATNQPHRSYRVVWP